MTHWNCFIAHEKKQSYFVSLLEQLQRDREQYTIFPQEIEILSAFYLTELKKVKVVILGQDPYHGINQAHGLAFSVQPNVKIPPSLRNIFKELKTDIAGFEMPNQGCLIPWAEQGVFLLNTTLTVRAGCPQSHQHFGWEIFTDKAIKYINDYQNHVVFVLWGAAAQKKVNLIDTNKHLILQAPHPSPLSAYKGFFGCGHFSKINQFLSSQQMAIIDWQI